MVIKKDFLKTVLKCFDPDSYESLSKRTVIDGINYLFSLVFISFIIMAFLALPSVTRIPTYLQGEFSKLDTASINYELEMSSPIKITEVNPKIVIDSTGETTNITDEVLLITNKGLFYNFNGPKLLGKKDLADLTGVNEKIGKFATVLVLLIMPSILIISFFVNLIKYILLILLFSFIGLIGVKFLKFKLKMSGVLKIAIYSSTIMVLTDILSIPFFNNTYYIPIILYMIIFTMGLVMVGEKK